MHLKHVHTCRKKYKNNLQQICYGNSNNNMNNDYPNYR